MEENTNKSNAEMDTDQVVSLREQIVGLEKQLGERNEELNTARKSTEELNKRLVVTSTALTEAVAGYRKLILETNSDVTEDLINGESIQAISASLSKAKNLIEKLRQKVEKDVAHSRIPIGSPGRQNPDLSGMSPREKIHFAIGGKK
jgi:chromosome segregation ATPase